MNQLEYIPGVGGAAIKLDGPRAFVGTAEEMRGREWDYTLGYRDLTNAVRPARTVDVTLWCDPDTANALRRAGDADVVAGKPGTFVAQGEWRQHGFVLEARPRGIHYDGLEIDLKVALMDGAWWRLVERTFMPDDTMPETTYDSATGEVVSTSGAADAPLHALTIYGKSVQDGTPSPSSPVPVQVVEGKNLFDGARSGYLTGSASSSSRVYPNTTDKGTYYYAPIDNDTEYTVTAWPADNIARFKLFLFKTDPLDGQSHATADVMVVNDIGTLDQVTTSSFNSGEYNYAVLGVGISSSTYNPNAQAQLEAGSTATPYVPYGAIGISVDGSITPIDLDGNVLASLPDGTRDELNVDSSGHAVLTKRVAVVPLAASVWSAYSGRYRTPLSTIGDPNDDYANTMSTAYAATSVTSSSQPANTFRIVANGNYGFLGSNSTVVDAVFYYQLKDEQTIDLGTITMPSVTNDSQVSIVAAVTPVITATWQTSPDVYLDYPFNYPFDYGQVAKASAVESSTLTPSETRIVVYGPAENPYVTVGGNRYEVDVTVPAGGYLVVDGRAKTIELVLADGTRQNAFAYGVRGNGAGGGSYIFERLAPGVNEVAYDGTFGFDFGWYEEEGEPPWSRF